ncbi:uncharacterized protein LOC134283278, partial [Saccostrea cucullata]|uniref:uncharacterized protein LOC134283278 n=1 Tax=Saccostrea cuccullata TaxID=36930 RepID=UPI002ED18531
MDYVFGLSMVLALMIRDVIPCNIQGVTQCAQSTDYSTLSDPQKSCLEWKKFEECVSPFSDACAENPTYVGFYNNMKILKSNCGGSSGASCDVMGLQKCMSVVESSQNENSGLEETCKVLPAFLQCVDPLRKACDDGDQLYNNIKGSIADFERKCAGVSSECNIVEVSKCFTSFKMPENTQSMSPQDKQTMCASIQAVKSCIEPYKSACAANPSFTTMMSSMTQAAMLCGDSGCNLMKCYSDAGIVMDSTGGKSPNISCDGYMSLKTCVESQASACQQSPVYSNVQESLEKAGVMCGSPGKIMNKKILACCLRQ